jgi:hypothetical protein
VRFVQSRVRPIAHSRFAQWPAISEIFKSERKIEPTKFRTVISRLADASDVLNAYNPSLSFLLSFSPMLIRQSVARLVAQPSHLGASPQSVRNMATLRELELRLKSVRNIEKITKVSKPFSEFYYSLRTINIIMHT